jgi:hypothetical protein
MTLAVLALFAFLVAGCVPERVVWSPDGTQAAVLGSDGLHLCDPDGKIGPLLVPEVWRVAWLPDGKHLLVAVVGNYAHWNEIAKDSGVRELPADDIARVKAALISSSGGMDEVKAFESSPMDLPGDQRDRALIYLRDNGGDLPAPARELLDKLPDGRIYAPVLCRIYEISGNSVNPGPIVYFGRNNRTLELRISPDGAYVAITSATYENNSKEQPSLFICPLKRSEGWADLPLGPSNVFPDWAPDGKSILYFRPLVGGDKNDDTKICTLARQGLFDEKGGLLPSGKLQAREDLVGTLFDPLSRVRCAADGRIFFTSVNVTLPVAPNDIPSRPSLFSIQPGKQAIVSRVIPHGVETAAGDSLQFFELSPDGLKISMPWGDGRVSILTIATGDLLQAQTVAYGGSEHFDLQSIPTWRTSDEITFIRPVESDPGKREVVRYNVADPQHKTVVMSAAWDDAVSKDWLKQVPSTQPTAFPTVH